MSSFINNENRQFQPRSAMARKKKLTREEQLAIWKKKRAEKNKQKGSMQKSQFNRIKNIQKRLNHSGKKRIQKEKKVRRIEEESAEKKRRNRSLTNSLNKVEKEKSHTRKELHKNVKSILKSPHHVTKSPHRIATLQQRLSNSAAKRKEKERKRLLELKQNAQKARRCSFSKPRSVRKGSILKKEILPKNMKVISSIKNKNNLIINKHCDSPSSFDTENESMDSKNNNTSNVNIRNSIINSNIKSKLTPTVNNILTPTVKRMFNNNNKNHTTDSNYPHFHVNSPAVQKIVQLFSPLMSPLVKKTVIEEECKIIKEENLEEFNFVCNIDNDDLTFNDDDNADAFADEKDDEDDDDDDEVQLIAPKDVSKIRQAPSSIIKMKKIKLNAKEQINTGNKHAITPVRRSVRVMSSGEDEANLEDVNFNFVPNKHLENAYFFSDNKKSIKKLFQIQTKDGSFRRPTPRPMKKKSANNSLVLPIYHASNNGSSSTTTTTTTTTTTSTMMMPPRT